MEGSIEIQNSISLDFVIQSPLHVLHGFGLAYKAEIKQQ